MTTDPVPSTSRAPTTLDRRVAWLAIGLAMLSLALVALDAREERRVHWWSWALPLLIIANMSTSTFGLLRRWPRLNKAFPFVSILIGVAIIVALVRRT